MSPQLRPIVKITQGMPTSDGAGVKLTRLLGTPDLRVLDPFLMLDKFHSDNPAIIWRASPLIRTAVLKP
jgi:redox-sensitive bicupin YhaK (pirin superfamily)